ncbi:MAG: sulfotransferase domain-containing protein [Candidatus Marinimicrobia bacterium]|nr:sulfotransferase domain-containing protein [Candidatus Neomarinimicrobiota bacterium]
MKPTFAQKLKAWSFIPKFLYDGFYFSMQKRGWIKNRYQDCCIVSYPKSGRTWLHVMLDFLHLNIKYKHDTADALYTPEMAFNLAIKKEVYENLKVIFLIRDPRDVIVSSYFQAMKRQARAFNFTLSQFIRDEKMGIRKLIEFQNNWARSREIPKKFMVLRYEDLKTDTTETLNQLLAFFEITGINKWQVNRAVKTFEFQNMQLLEKMHILKLRHGKILKPNNIDDQNSFKTRKGKIKGYLDTLSVEDIQYCDEMVKKFSDLY